MAPKAVLCADWSWPSLSAYTYFRFKQQIYLNYYDRFSEDLYFYLKLYMQVSISVYYVYLVIKVENIILTWPGLVRPWILSHWPPLSQARPREVRLEIRFINSLFCKQRFISILQKHL